MLVKVKIPSPGESISEVEILRWLKNNGDFVEKDEVLCEVESDKATLSIYAEFGGKLNILAPAQKIAKVGEVVCTIETNETASATNPIESPAKVLQPASSHAETNGQVPNYAKGCPSIAARKIMTEEGIKPEEIKGTGKAGRITKGDVLEKKQVLLNSSQTTFMITNKENIVASGGSRNTRREKMSHLRKKISQRLVAVKNETAMLTTFNEVDMSKVLEIRAQYKEKFKETYDVKLGFMSFFVRAVTEAMKNFQEINAMIDDGEIVYHDYVDMGIAVSAPRGLVVPVIRNAERLMFAQIESAIITLAGKANRNELSIDEMTGGTFTITNGGIFGSMMSTPIINPPQSAILGMHNIIQRPVVINSKIEIRPIMYIALSYDHRIIDGRESVRFLVRVKELLEDPLRLLLEV